MKKTSQTIVFFGSGPVAEKSLEFLSNIFNIEAIITKPRVNDRDPAQVIDLAKKLGITYYAPKNKVELDNLLNETSFKSYLAVLIDYGIIVSQKVIDSFKLGIANSHFSLLPKWRGADPISFAILNGDTSTGVSLMLLDAKMDEGLLLFQEKLAINNLDSNELTAKLIALSNSVLEKILPSYIDGTIKPYAQALSNISYSRKLTKEDGKINWSNSATDIERQIRAFIEWPKSHTDIFGVSVIITQAKVLDTKSPSGQIFFDKKNLIVGCKDSNLQILKLKPIGKNEMDAASFIAGYSNKA